MAEAVNVLAGLAQISASDVKKRGWKGVMRLLGDKGAMLVTNHDQPEAVILPTAEYARLRGVVRKEAERLDAAEDIARAEWGSRLEVLNEPGARERMDRLLSGPITLNGAVKAGEGW